MEFSDLSLEERLFRIDDECYILYLGSKQEDIKPFLRIGNSQRITSDIIESTYNIVVTDSLTGNPTLEPENMNQKHTKENRYVGDRGITTSLLNFIHQFDVEDGMVGAIEDMKKAHRQAEVHFYDDGNIQVLYGRDPVFDLRKRERSDFHFVERASLLKEIHNSNPNRYRPEDLKIPGFTVLKGCTLLFDGAEAIAVGSPASYFESLVNAGIDPDIIKTIIADDTGGSFFNLLKRKWNTRQSIRILTANTTLMKSASALFHASGAGKLRADITSFKSGERRNIGGFRIERTDRGILSTHKSFTWPLLISDSPAREAEKLKLNPRKNMLIQPASGSGEAVPLPEGVLHRMVDPPTDRREMVKTYFDDVYPIIESELNPKESLVAKLLDQILEDIGQNRIPQPTIDRVRKSLKKLKLSEQSTIFYLLNNVRAMIDCFSQSGGDDEVDISPLITLRDSIHRKLSSLNRVAQYLPVTGEIIATDSGVCILYRPVRGSMSADALATARDLTQDIDERAGRAQGEFDRELIRLNTLVCDLRGIPERKRKNLITKGLSASAQAAIHAEDLALPKTGGLSAGRKKKDGAGPEPGKVETPEERQAYTTAPVQQVSYTRKLSGPIKLIIPGAVIAVAAIILALFFLLPDGIGGWTRRDSRDTSVTSGQADNATAESAGGDAVGEDAVGEDTAGEDAVGVGIEEEKPEYETDETLAERDIPHSALTPQRTVIYRGRIEITVLDIYLLTNEIALSNNYRRLDSIEEVGRDPDWIYPDNLFILPDTNEYTVVKGDTMWYIAHRFIIHRLEEDWAPYTGIEKEIGAGISDTQRREVLIKELKYLRERSYSENFTKEIDKNIGKLEDMV